MNSVYQSKPHGHIRLLVSEFADWDRASGQWQTPQRTTLTHFRADGLPSEFSQHLRTGIVYKTLYHYDGDGRLREVEFQTSDRPVSRSFHYYDDLGRLLRQTNVGDDGKEIEFEVWHYDERGRKTRTQYLPKVEAAACGGLMVGVEDAQQVYGPVNAVEGRTSYDDNNLPSEASFYDANHTVVLRVVLGRDEAGRLISEEFRIGDTPPFSIEEQITNASPEERDAVRAALAQLYGPQTVTSRTTYLYDERGRQVERRRSIHGMCEERTTWRYDEHDNPVTEVQESVSRDMDVDSAGVFQPQQERSSRSEVRYEYKYDQTGNWIERVVWARIGGSGDFQPSNVERRQIGYWADEE